MSEFRLLPCPRCGSQPTIFGEGKSVSTLEDGRWNVFYSTQDKIIIKCANCERKTKYHTILDLAYRDWNKVGKKK